MTHNQSSMCNVARQQHFVPCFKAMFQWVHVNRLHEVLWMEWNENACALCTQPYRTTQEHMQCMEHQHQYARRKVNSLTTSKWYTVFIFFGAHICITQTFTFTWNGKRGKCVWVRVWVWARVWVVVGARHVMYYRETHIYHHHHSENLLLHYLILCVCRMLSIMS